MSRHSRSLAVLTLLALAGVGVEFSPAVAAPPKAAVLAAATGTAATTAQPTTPNTTPGTRPPASTSTTSSRVTYTMPPYSTTTTARPTTTTVFDLCMPALPSATNTATTTSLSFSYSSPSAYQCGVFRTTTLALYADAAHTSLVSSTVVSAGVVKGAHAFTGLTPSTDYYLVMTLQGVASTALPATRTATPVIASSTTTTGPCETGGTAVVTPVAAAPTTLTYTYAFGANYCRIASGTLTVSLYSDAARTQLVKTWSPPPAAAQGAYLVSGLAPSTTYYASGWTSGTLSVPVTIAPFTTASAVSGTTTTTIACDPFPSQAAFASATTSSLTFTFSSPGATGCNANAVTTITVFADAAHTVVAGKALSAGGATSGTLTVTGLNPSTTYYPTVRLSNEVFSSSTMPSARTLGLSTATTTTTSQPICDPAGAEASFDSATSTSLRFAFVAGGANYCPSGGPYITTISVYSDSAHTVLVGSASSADRAASGFLTVSGLTPNTTYYPFVRMSGSPFGPSILPAVKTLPTTTTCQPIGLAGPSAITSSSFTWTLPSSLCATTLTATAYGSQADAIAQVNPIKAVTVTLPASSLTLGGLQPSRDYWVRFSGGFGLQGPLHTAGGTTTTVTCDPVPSTATYLRNSIASVTFTFNAPGGAACGGGVTTITLYRDAAHTVAAASASSARGATSGTLEVATLSPGTTYYPVVRLDTSPFSSPTMPAVTTQPFGTTTGTTTSTIPLRPCVATWQTVSAWPGGFLGQITVRNTSTVVSSSWKVGWTWTGSARLTASYHATLGGTALSPTLTALDWNRVIQPGASTTIQVQGTATDALATPTIGCTLS